MLCYTAVYGIRLEFAMSHLDVLHHIVLDSIILYNTAVYYTIGTLHHTTSYYIYAIGRFSKKRKVDPNNPLAHFTRQEICEAIIINGSESDRTGTQRGYPATPNDTAKRGRQQQHLASIPLPKLMLMCKLMTNWWAIIQIVKDDEGVRP